MMGQIHPGDKVFTRLGDSKLYLVKFLFVLCKHTAVDPGTYCEHKLDF